MQPNVITDISDIFYRNGLSCGRMISPSKRTPTGCECVWNANIITPTHGKIWFGDINITKESSVLKKIANEIGEPIYVLREGDARFGKENEPITKLINKAVWSTKEK